MHHDSPQYDIAQAKLVQPLPAVPQEITVAPGGTLSRYASTYCHDPADWTGIYVRNKAVIGNDPDLILPGQKLVLDCRQAPVTITAVTVSQPSSGGGSSFQADPPSQGPSQVNPSSYSGFQACVIARESGGQSQVMNSTGHYGLYQFAAGTWAAYGGNPADFGHASVAEQNQVFANAMAAGGEGNWRPYDGC